VLTLETGDLMWAHRCL